MDHLASLTSTHNVSIPIAYRAFRYSTDHCVHSSERMPLCQRCAEHRKNGRWLNFPNRMGWPRANFSFGGFQIAESHGSNDFEGLIQAWLYLGMVTEFFSMMKITQDDFIKTLEDGQEVIDSSKLSAATEEWCQACTALPSLERSNALDDASELLRSFADVIRLNIGRQAAFPMPIAVELKLAIIVLGDTLEIAREHFAEMRKWPITIDNDAWTYDQLRQQFWCPRDLCKLHNSIVRYYYAGLGPRVRRTTHQACTTEECTAYDVADMNYCSQHALGCSDCGFKKVSPGAATAFIMAGKVPLVSWDVTHQELRLTAIDMDSPTSPEFVAISHVWADGLGNPARNAVHQCQAESIHSDLTLLQTNKLIPETCVLWFLDTLCVPITKNKVARAKIISIMGTIYEKARMVLVRDYELMRCSMQCSIAEAMARACMSQWCFRLWTLLEAFVNTRVWFRFKDDFLNFERGMDFLFVSTEGYTSLPHGYLCRLLWIYGSELQRQGPLDRSQNVLFAFLRAHFRRTSHQWDELICIALIARFLPDEVQTLQFQEPDEQLVRFLRLTKRIPADIILGSGPRLDRDGYRWCPSRLLRAYTLNSQADSQATMQDVTASGLKGHWISVRFVLGQETHTVHASGPGLASSWIFKLWFDNGDLSTHFGIVLERSIKPDFWNFAQGLNLAFLFQCQKQTWEIHGVLVQIIGESNEGPHPLTRARFICSALSGRFLEDVWTRIQPDEFSGATRDSSMTALWCLT